MRKILILPLFIGVFSLYALKANSSMQPSYTICDQSAGSGIMDRVLEEAAIEFYEVHGIIVTFDELKTEWESGTTTITQNGSNGSWSVARSGGGIVIVVSENGF